MEGGAYNPYPSSTPGQMSRMERDLSTSPHNPGAYINGGRNIAMIRRILHESRKPHVCIVGAGISGLRCAAILGRKGLKVTILEARDRVGGRIHQNDFLGHLVDLGPNWIHGLNNNPIMDIAQRTNTAVFPPEFERTLVYDELGQLLSDERGVEITELVWKIIGEAFQYSNEESASIPQDMSLMDFFEAAIKEWKLDEATSKLVLQMAHIWGDYVGESIEKQSLKYCWLEECLDEKNLFVAGTYKAILAQIASAALAEADLRLSTKVTSISSTVSSSENPSVTVTTATNERLTFDEVIMTTPLGWLKRNLSTFSPPLPPRLTTAIKHMSYGRLEKVYITFPAPFWATHVTSGGSLNGTSQTPAAPFLFQFLFPKCAALQKTHRGTIGSFSLAALPPPTAHPTLLFYLNGLCGQYVTSLISGLVPTSPKYHSLLVAFFQPYISRLPNYDPTSQDCEPVHILSTNWQNDELAGWGSYTNFQISRAPNSKTQDASGTSLGNSEDAEDVRLDKDIETLREGCPDRGLWLAGEHTAPFVALGTVTGAYWSGEAVGRRIAAAYGFGTDSDELAEGEEGESRVSRARSNESISKAREDSLSQGFRIQE